MIALHYTSCHNLKDDFSRYPDCFNIHSYSMTSFNHLPSQCLSFVMCWTQHLLLFSSESVSKVTQLQSELLSDKWPIQPHTHQFFSTPHPAGFTMDSISQPVTSPWSDYLLPSLQWEEEKYLSPLTLLLSWQVSVRFNFMHSSVFLFNSRDNYHVKAAAEQVQRHAFNCKRLQTYTYYSCALVAWRQICITFRQSPANSFSMLS